MQIWWNELRYSNCLVMRRGPGLFLYTSSSVSLFQKIHETPKIWHPCEQNYLFVYYHKRAIFPMGVKILEILEGRGRVIRQIPSVGLVWIFSGTTKLSVTLRLEQQSCRTMTKLSSLSYSDRFLSTTLVKTLGPLTQWLVKLRHLPFPLGAVLTLCFQVLIQHNQHCLGGEGDSRNSPL